MTAGTARGARQVPGPGSSSSAASLSLRDLKLWGLGRDAHPSSLLGKTPSGAPGTELELSWRGCVCPPWDVVLPSFQGFGAGEELGCRERPRCGSGVTRSGAGPHRCSLVGLAWLQRDMGPQPGQTKLVASPGTLALPCPAIPAIPAVPGSARRWNRALAASCCRPASLLASNPTCFQKLSIFNDNFCVCAFRGLGVSVFWSPSLFGSSWGRCWPRVVLVSPGQAGLLGAGSRPVPIPGSTSRCQLCQPSRSTAPGWAGSPLPVGAPRFLPGKETPGNPNRLSQGEKQTALDLESTSTSCQPSLSSLPSNQQGFSPNPTFPT